MNEQKANANIFVLVRPRVCVDFQRLFNASQRKTKQRKICCYYYYYYYVQHFSHSRPECICSGEKKKQTTDTIISYIIYVKCCRLYFLCSNCILHLV